MSNLIQIKRSQATATPTSLANGELAWSSNGNILYIGNFAGGVTAIGGTRTPGVLTANQALVANSTSGIDKIIVANAVVTTVTANGTAGAAGQVLTSNGTTTYWAAPVTTLEGLSNIDTTGVANGDVLAYYNGTWVDFDITGGTGITTSSNATAITVTLNNTAVTVGSYGDANTVGTFTVDQQGRLTAAGSADINHDTLLNFVANEHIDHSAVSITAGNGLTGGGNITASRTLAVVAGTNGGLVSNATGVFVASGSTLTVNATGVHVNTANLVIATSQLSGDVALGTNTSGNYVATITAGNGISGSSASEGGTPTIAVVAGAGIASNSTGVHVVAGSGGGLVSNSTGVFVTAGSGLVANATGVHVGAANGISVAADTVGVTTGSTLTVNSTGIHVNSQLSLTDLTLSGNLTVTGTLTTLDTTNLIVEDPMIELANGNSTTDALDIGFFGQYGATGTKFTGLFRDATDGVYKLYTGLTVEPTTTVDTAGIGYTQAVLQAFLNSGGLVSNSSAVTLTANSTLAVNLTANTLTLTTPLAATSGGTGLNSYTSGDIIVANTGNALSKLSLGASGLLLQSNGTALVYDSLDGGTF